MSIHFTITTIHIQTINVGLWQFQFRSSDFWPTVLTVATVLCPSIVILFCRLSFVTYDVWIVHKQYVLQQKLLLTAYEESIGTKMNNIDLCLEVV